MYRIPVPINNFSFMSIFDLFYSAIPDTDSQSKRILKLLHSKDVVSLPEIRRLGISNHTALISKLRKKGHTILCEKAVSRQNGAFKEVHTYYSMVPNVAYTEIERLELLKNHEA